MVLEVRPLEDSSLIDKATRHAQRLQVAIIAVALVLTVVPSLIYPPLEAWFDDLGLPSDSFWMVFITPISLLWGIYASWSAIWISFGSGRWVFRLLASFLIFHIAVLFGVSVAMGAEMFRQGLWVWKDMLAVEAAVSYVFAGQIIVLMLCLWPLKLLRFRLLYFDSPQQYPHPRQVGLDVPLEERPATSLLSARIYLADMFVLTALIAIYLAAWYPLIEVGLDDDRMFGADFGFLIVMIVFGTGAAVGVPGVLIPLTLAMLDHRGKRFQLICQSILFAVFTLGAVAIVATQQFDDEVVLLCAISVMAFVLCQLLLLLVLRKPSRWFRFRLVRVKGTRDEGRCRNKSFV